MRDHPDLRLWCDVSQRGNVVDMSANLGLPAVAASALLVIGGGCGTSEDERLPPPVAAPADATTQAVTTSIAFDDHSIWLGLTDRAPTTSRVAAIATSAGTITVA